MGGHEEVKISFLALLPHAHKNISENMKLDYLGVDAFVSESFMVVSKNAYNTQNNKMH